MEKQPSRPCCISNLGASSPLQLNFPVQYSVEHGPNVPALGFMYKARALAWCETEKDRGLGVQIKGIKSLQF